LILIANDLKHRRLLPNRRDNSVPILSNQLEIRNSVDIRITTDDVLSEIYAENPGVTNKGDPLPARSYSTGKVNNFDQYLAFTSEGQ
jgi:hypothetical protein